MGEEEAVGHCPLDPIEFMDYLGPNLDWTYQLAPGAKDVAARAAQSMTNLDSNCFRYLILEKYHDGIGKLRSTFPEFSHVGLNWGARNAQPQLAASELARLRRYMSNATIMETIKRRHAKMQEVYDHAVAITMLSGSRAGELLGSRRERERQRETETPKHEPRHFKPYIVFKLPTLR